MFSSVLKLGPTQTICLGPKQIVWVPKLWGPNANFGDSIQTICFAYRKSPFCRDLVREVSHSVLKLGSSPSPKLGSSKKVDEGVPSQNPLELAFGLVMLTRPNRVRGLTKGLTALNP